MNYYAVIPISSIKNIEKNNLKNVVELNCTIKNGPHWCKNFTGFIPVQREYLIVYTNNLSLYEKVNEFVGSGIDLQTSIDYHSEFMTDDDRNKNYLSLRITPGLDRYYEIGIVDDGAGITRKTQTDLSGSTTTSITEEKTFFCLLYSEVLQ